MFEKNFNFEREKLQIFLVEWGLGVFYHYNSKNGKCFPVIAMPYPMLKFSKELFAWVFEHELEHFIYYSDYKNWDKKNNMFKEAIRLFKNKDKAILLNKYEKEHPDICYKKDYDEINRKLDEL